MDLDEEDESMMIPKYEKREKPPPLEKKENIAVYTHLDEPLRECLKLIKELRQHPFALVFNEPVDPVKLGIPTYFDVVTDPMDLGTIEKNIVAGDYMEPEEVAEDVRLIWKNAHLFNPPGHEILKMADTLGSFFNRKYKRILDRHGFVQKSTQNNEQVALLHDSIQTRREEMKKSSRTN